MSIGAWGAGAEAGAVSGLESCVGLSLSPVQTLAGSACQAQLVGCGPVFLITAGLGISTQALYSQSVF